MNKLFAILVVMVLCVVGIGFYRSWFAMTIPSSDTDSHKVNVGVTVDLDKVKADTETVKEKTTELTEQATEEIHELVDQANDGA